jgi:hypothetical protein
MTKIVLWTGGDAPNREAQLHVDKGNWQSCAYWEPGYCGCEDCKWIVAYGPTPEAAIANYWEQWSERYE